MKLRECALDVDERGGFLISIQRILRFRVVVVAWGEIPRRSVELNNEKSLSRERYHPQLRVVTFFVEQGGSKDATL